VTWTSNAGIRGIMLLRHNDPLILTSNRGFAEWGAAALLDRFSTIR
jgi:hypothetical protein